MLSALDPSSALRLLLPSLAVWQAAGVVYWACLVEVKFVDTVGQAKETASMIRRSCVLFMLVSLLLLGCQQESHNQKQLPTRVSGPFNASRAFSHLVAQVNFGPRVPGTEAHRRCLDYIIHHLSSAAKSLQTQQFPIDCYDEPIKGTNILATFGNGAGEPIFYCCHWDTRPIANKDPNPDNRYKPIPGANDGASGVAVLLELATLFHEKPPPRDVSLVFLDAEDSGDYRECEFCIGSYYLARNLDSVFSERPSFGVLIDMIGDRDLSIPKERYSVALAPDVVNSVWAIARRLGCSQFKDEIGPSVFDDHIWFNRAGVPTIDIIDFDYPVWHTLQDNVDHCSKESLKAVGDVLYALASEK
ncbi:MAG: hypothetical protein DRH70_02075 [Candidatus Coatesbacteria bacterium]|nr:MAG: hypothetical protein DRH70_02075 [Candidatus Coatesbacteria bacterium]